MAGVTATGLAAVRAADRAAREGVAPPALDWSRRPPARRRWQPGETLPLASEPGLPLGALLWRSLAAEPPQPALARTRLRRVPSAGGLYPVEAHLVVGAGCDLPPGTYHYDPLAHAATRRAGARHPAAGALVVLTLVPQRTIWKYGLRSLPILLLDLGHAVGALAAAAQTLGLSTWATFDANGADLARLTALPSPDRWLVTWPDTDPEYPLAAVWVTREAAPPPALDTVLDTVLDTAPCGAAAATGGTPPSARPCPRLTAGSSTMPAPVPAARKEVTERVGAGAEPVGDRVDVGGDLVYEALRTLARGGAGARWRRAGLGSPVTAEVLIRRRSARPPLAGSVRTAVLAEVLREGGAAGQPEVSCLATVAEPEARLVAEEGGALRTRGLGEARPTLAFWACEQGFLADAGAVVLFTAAPPPWRHPDAASAYRRTYLTAGYAGHLALLAAEMRGVRTRPVGCWQRADLGEALGLDSELIVHAVVLGGGGAAKP
ncbi:hypothetical protein TH66_05720 [Carbonactinospora thermoautotrophica]|uniref:Nitroreductase domain-containing protein n=3 Tax=Carbonactinospora thermoautotrophica TaxID=1469144 RepID=A0A132N3N8_9ACTN|nr:hypothetical protein TH66_05720 [Carbonactinospora thermoautotrophica]